MTYGEFWLRYLRAHARPVTRLVHYLGSLSALALLAAGIVTADWRWIVAAPLVGYGAAWGAHLFLEGNRPETFGHPLWSLLSDYRMLALALSGQLGPHLAQAAATRAS